MARFARNASTHFGTHTGTKTVPRTVFNAKRLPFSNLSNYTQKIPTNPKRLIGILAGMARFARNASAHFGTHTGTKTVPRTVFNAKRLPFSNLSNYTRKIPTNPKRLIGILAGMARFELTDDGVKVRCLTAWLHPYIKIVKLQTLQSGV